MSYKGLAQLLLPLFAILIASSSTYAMSDKTCDEHLNESTPALDIKSFGNFFQAVKFKTTQVLNYKIADFDNQNIEYTVTKSIFDLPTFDYSKNEFSIIEIGRYSIELPEEHAESNKPYVNYSLNIQFDNLTEEQFVFLKGYYKTTQNLFFTKGKVYHLSDFLPLAAQKVLNSYYITHRETFSKRRLTWYYSLFNEDRSLEVSSTSNCWNAAWEYLRNSTTEFATFFAPVAAVNDYFNDPKYSSEIAKLNKTQILNKVYREQSLSGAEPGDLILIYQKMRSMAQGEFEALSHVAIYLGGGLVFEKTNNGSAHPFKISLLTSAIDNLSDKEDSAAKTTLADLGKTRIVVRRFNKVKLPHAQEALSFKQTDGVFASQADIPASLMPSEDVLKSYTIVGDLGTGGNILFEYLYKIINHKL